MFFSNVLCKSRDGEDVFFLFFFCFFCFFFWGGGVTEVNFGVPGANFGGHWGITRRTLRATNLELGTDTCLGSGKMPVHYGVTGLNFGVTGVNFRVAGA